MKTKKLLEGATKETAQEAIATATERGWTPDAILRHGNAAVKTVLGKATSATVAVAPAKKQPKQPKPRPSADFSKVKPVSFAGDFTPYTGGAPVQEFVSGQRGIIGPRKAVYAMLTTDSGRKFRLSEASLERLLAGERVLTWVNEVSTYITLA